MGTCELPGLFGCDSQVCIECVCVQFGHMLATGRVPTVSIICSSSHTYLTATSRSPGSQYFFPLFATYKQFAGTLVGVAWRQAACQPSSNMFKLAYLLDCDKSQPLAASIFPLSATYKQFAGTLVGVAWRQAACQPSQ